MIVTGREERPVAGVDSMIVGMPPALVQLGPREAYPAQVLNTVFRSLSESSAARLGETLHHAEWVITTDPATVEKIGMTHDCPVCRAMTDRALARLSEVPDKPLLAGLLYWAGT